MKKMTDYVAEQINSVEERIDMESGSAEAAANGDAQAAANSKNDALGGASQPLPSGGPPCDGAVAAGTEEQDVAKGPDPMSALRNAASGEVRETEHGEGYAAWADPDAVAPAHEAEVDATLELYAEPSDEELREEAERLAAVVAECAEIKEQRARLQSDFDKFRVRTEEQRATWAPRAKRKVLEASLTIYDDLHRWLEAAPMPGDEGLSAQAYQALRHGAELVRDSLADMVGRFSASLPESLPQTDTTEGAIQYTEPTPDLAASYQPEAELEQERISLRRTVSDYKAYTKRAKAEREEREQQARASVSQALQAVLDGFRSSLDRISGSDATEAPDEAYAQLEGAMVQVSDAFRSTLERFDVTLMEVLDRPFEVERHEAVGQASVPDKKPGTVIYEVRRGYMFSDQVLRYAQVIVAA